MVKIRATEELKAYLVSKSLPSQSVYNYKEIREALLSAPEGILRSCDFAWPEHAAPKSSPLLEQIKERRKEREYQEMTSNVQRTQPQTINELTTELGMGVTMISILFLGMLSGYYLGKYFFGFGEWGSLVLSFIVTVIGIYVEVILYLIKTDKKKVKTD